MRQIRLADHFRLARIADIDRGKIFRRALMRKPDDAPPVGGDLHRHALTHAAEAREHVVRQELEIPDYRLIALGQRAVFGDRHSSLSCSLLLLCENRAWAPLRARSMKSGRCALRQSGTALISLLCIKISA